MQWHQVVIPDNDCVDAAVKSLLHAFVSEYIEAGVPEGASIYGGRTAQGDHVFYFSPVASSIAIDLLDACNAVPCASEPDLTGLRQISI